MAAGRANGIGVRQRRRWSFADCVFDEASWTLSVNGRRVAVETKPLELLRELLLHAGDLVPKDQLMDTIWPDVEVVEASLPTAIAKLRRALGDDQRDAPIIETVQRLGYRLAVPVEVEHLPEGSKATTLAPQAAAAGRRAADARPGKPALALGIALAIGAVVIALVLGTDLALTNRSEAKPRIYTKTDVFNALRKVDVETMEKMLAAGWDPNAPLDEDANGGINMLLNNCEWDRGHDRRKMLLAARTLVDGGARVADRNAWGDTSYSIAKAERYCGPDHPVTQFFHMVCYEGGNPIGDRCLANYIRDASGEVIRQKPQRAK